MQPLLELPGGGSLGGFESEVLGRLSLSETLSESERLSDPDVSRDTLPEGASLGGVSLGGLESEPLGRLSLSDVERLPDLDVLPETLWLADPLPLGGLIVLPEGPSLLASLPLADSLWEPDSLWDADSDVLSDTLPETLWLPDPLPLTMSLALSDGWSMLPSLPLADWLRPSDWLSELPGPSESLTRESLRLSERLDMDSDSLPSEPLEAESLDSTSVEIETLLDPLGVSIDWDDSD